MILNKLSSLENIYEKYKPLIIEKVKELDTNDISDEAFLGILRTVYNTILPNPVKILLREDVFVNFFFERKSVLLSSASNVQAKSVNEYNKLKKSSKIFITKLFM